MMYTMMDTLKIFVSGNAVTQLPPPPTHSSRSMCRLKFYDFNRFASAQDKGLVAPPNKQLQGPSVE